MTREPCDWLPLSVATSNDAETVRLRPRCPGQSAARFRPFPVPFLSAMPAAAVHRLAADLRRLVCPARPGHGGDVRDCGHHADPYGVSGRPLRGASLSDRRHLADD